MNSTSTSCTHFAECSTTPAAQNLKIDYLSRNTCDVPESSGTLAPASVERDELRVISNNAFVDKKGEDEYYIAYGDVSQIWKRQMKSTGQMALLELVKEWQSLEHANIMPCLGVTYGFGLIASVVMPLCPEGNINDYVRDHPHANKLDLKNIVVAPNGCPLVTDAGLAQAIRSQEGIFPWAVPSESLRWQAPETFGPDLDDAYTASSDVWSLAMTILEVMSGRVPYYPRRQIHATAFAIMDGVLPKRPDNDTVSDSLWDVLRTSWAKNPSDRPCAALVRRQLETLQADNLHHLYKL
ncbi:hypothetical protein HWV62_30489 [Athelia sp. TMB]|nr:hypothetical protein HWV62_30489 [Athelia sp. TMB]